MAKGGKKLAEALEKVDEFKNKAGAAVKRASEVAKKSRELGVTDMASAAAGGTAAAWMEKEKYLNLEAGDYDVPLGGLVLGAGAALLGAKAGKMGSEIRAAGLGAIGYAGGRVGLQVINQWKANSEKKEGN